jgi:hypothetical protein
MLDWPTAGVIISAIVTFGIGAMTLALKAWVAPAVTRHASARGRSNTERLAVLEAQQTHLFEKIGGLEGQLNKRLDRIEEMLEAAADTASDRHRHPHSEDGR